MEQTIHKIVSLFNILVEDDAYRELLGNNSEIIGNDLNRFNIQEYIEDAIDDITNFYQANLSESTFLKELDGSIKGFVDEYNKTSKNHFTMNTFLLHLGLDALYVDLHTGAYDNDFTDDIETKQIVSGIVENSLDEYYNSDFKADNLVIVILRLGVIIKDVPIVTLSFRNPYSK